MLKLLFSVLICFVQYCILIMFLQHYLKDRWKNSLKIFICKAVGICICAVTLTFINTFQNPLWNVLSVFTLSFILTFIFYKGKWFKKVFLVTVVCILSIASEVITVAMGSLILGENLMDSAIFPATKVPMIIISQVLLFTFVRIFFQFKKGVKNTRMGKAVTT